MIEKALLLRGAIRCRGRHVAGAAVLLSLIALLAFSTPAAATNTSSNVRGVASSPSSATKADSAAKRCKTRPRKCPRRKHGKGALRPKKLVRAVAPPASRLAGLPESVDLTAYRVPTGNQGQIGSCVAWAIDYAMLGWYSRHDGKPGQPFHPMYTYAQIKKPEGGSLPEDALIVAKTQGNDTRDHYHHSLFDDRTQPNASERANAANYKIADFKTVFSYPKAGGGSAGVILIERELAAGKPVAIEMRVRPGFKIYNRTSVAAATDTTSQARKKGSTRYSRSGTTRSAS